MKTIEQEKIEEIIQSDKLYQSLVFSRGFLITTNKTIDLIESVLTQLWICKPLGQYNVWLHPETTSYIYTEKSTSFLLIGHAYNPFEQQYDERDILRSLANHYFQSIDRFCEKVSELTGVFTIGVIDGKTLKLLTDAVSMQIVYLGVVDEFLYVTSHCNLVRSIVSLTRDPYVEELVNYKFYPLFGPVLPGDLSPYKELKRAQANYIYLFENQELKFERVFPKRKLQACESEEEYNDIIQKIGDILESNLILIAKKWGKEAAISLTGGRDSTTTLAAARQVYDSLGCFSYISCEGETADAEAAHTIATNLGLKHDIYYIPINDKKDQMFENYNAIIEYNMGNIGHLKDKEIYKRIYFRNCNDFKVEIKSWVDEIGRARYHKRYKKEHFPARPTPRYLTTMYKAFLHNRKLVKETDLVFKEYLDKYYREPTFSLIPWWDLFYWEFSWGAGEALALTNEHRLVYEVTIPFNCRKLLELMLTVPLNMRIKDRIQIDVIQKLNSKILENGVHVKDHGWTLKRELAERVYLEVHSRLPF
ncbi:MAG: hypothetical protein ACI3W5_02250 [Faecousia sp.]